MLRSTWILLPLLLLSSSHAAENRLYVVNQSEFGAKRGFYISFENTAPDGTPCKLGTLRLVLGVADGKQWQFAIATPKFTMGQLMRLEATIYDGKGTLHVDGAQVGQLDNHLSPAEGPVSAGETPGWASAPAEYMLVEHSVRIRSGSTIEHSFEGGLASGRLTLFEKPLPWSHAQTLTETAGITIDAVVTIEKPATASVATGPFIDRFGQAVDASFPGKVATEADIDQAGKVEKEVLDGWRTVRLFDKFGGLAIAPWTEKATGFYHTVKRSGMWWLITPLGTPCFYIGMCTAPDETWDASPATGRESIWQELPAKAGPFAPAWTTNPWGDSPGTAYVGFNTANLIRKFGSEWQAKTTAETEFRLAAWGFSGLGKWSDDPNLPSVPVINFEAPRIGRHPDVFDPAVLEKIRSSLEHEISPRKADPNVVGWSIGNEYDEIITLEEIVAALKLPDATPLKKALLNQVLSSTYGNDATALSRAWAAGAPAADLESMRRFYATTYYAFLYKAVKTIDPNHLYLGFWIVPDWWVNDSDWDLIAPNCDVIGFDRYSNSFSGIEGLLARFDKPVLLGEFSYPAWYEGLRGFGRYSVYTQSERESGEKYAALMGAASRNPMCIGALWFQYRDEPLTGRGPGHGSDLVIGEHYAFGFVDVADRPKTDLVTAARAANLRAATDRLGAGR